ncbi:hypothetical protein A2U01_0048896, partial [Trifolium medium]|nr:hypothetical protein [Trifolium medium]
LSSRASGALPSSTETPASTSTDKGKETCKVISLRSGKEYEGPSMGDIVTEANHKDRTEEHSVSKPSQSLSPATEASPEAVQKSKSDKASVDSEVAKLSSQVMIRERPPPPFPQRLRKAKEEKQ